MEMIKNEWKAITSNKLMLVTFIGMLFIPVLYAGFFIKSVWDPYGNAKDLPVAVVDLDQGTTFEGKQMNVGKDLVEELKKNKDLGWHFVSADKAQQGLEYQKYYMVVTIPKDFSANAATVLDAKPKKMQLNYETNGSTNYIGEKMSEVAISEVETQVSQNVSTAYLDTMKDKLTEVRSGMKDAADGAGKLDEGAQNAKGGSAELAGNLAVLSASSLEFSNGVDTLSVGLSQYTVGVDQANAGAVQLNQGVSQMAGEVPKLTSGVNALQSGTVAANSGMQQYNAGVAQLGQSIGLADQQLTTASEQLNQGAAQLAGGSQALRSSVETGMQNSAAQLNALDSSLSQLTGLSSQLVQDLSQLGGTQNVSLPGSDQTRAIASQLNAASFSAMTSEEQAAALANVQSQLDQLGRSLDAASQGAPASLGGVQAEAAQLNAGLQTASSALHQASAASQQAGQELVSGVQSIDAGVQSLTTQLKGYTTGVTTTLGQVAAGSHTLLQKGNELAAGTQQLAAGASELGNATPQLANGVTQLQSGTKALAQGTGELVDNGPSLLTGATALQSGAGQLSDGSQQLSAGANSLTSGLGELGDGAQTLVSGLEDGNKQASSVDITDDMISQMVAPAELKQREYSHVPNYGHALAPYVLSLALFMGCIVFNYIYPIRKISQKGKSALAWWSSKVTVGLVAAGGMALIESVTLLLLGLQVDHLAQYFLTIFAAAFSFMFLVMFLSMLLDNIGRFIAVLLLVLQLAASGGTFPMQVTGSFFNAVHPFLPMTHSIYGLREAITSGLGQHVFVENLLFLVLLGIFSLLLLLFSMMYLQKIHHEGSSKLDDNQLLQDLLNVPSK